MSQNNTQEPDNKTIDNDDPLAPEENFFDLPEPEPVESETARILKQIEEEEAKKSAGQDSGKKEEEDPEKGDEEKKGGEGKGKEESVKSDLEFNILEEKADPEPGQAKAEEPEKSSKEKPEDTSAGGLSEEDEAFLETLDEDTRELLEMHRYAEQQNENHKKAKTFRKALDWAKKDAQQRAKFIDEDPDTPVDENPDYLAWRKKQQPAYLSDREIRKLERQQDRDAAAGEAYKRFETEREKLERKIRELETAPKIEQEIRSVRDETIALIPEEIKNRYNALMKEHEGNPDKAINELSKEHPEAGRFTKVVRHDQKLYSTFLRVSGNLEEPDPSNPTHRELNDLIVRMENDPRREGHRNEKGQLYLKPTEYNQKLSGLKTKADREAFKKRHYTLTDDRIAANLRKIAVHRAARVFEEKKTAEQKMREKILEDLKAKGQYVEKPNPNGAAKKNTPSDEEDTTPVEISGGPAGSPDDDRGGDDFFPQIGGDL